MKSPTPARMVNAALVASGLLLLILSIYVHLKTGFFGDKQWEMLYAIMWLGGDHLYTDIFPVSPPMIFWVYAVPAWIAAHLAMDLFKTLAVAGLTVIALSIFLSVRLIALHPGFGASARRKAEFAGLLAFTLIFRTNPIFFLDREHLFLVLCIPYILRFLPGLSSAAVPLWLRVASALMAAVGFCMKPHCLVVFAGLQLVHMLMERSPRILVSLENLIIYAGGLLYLFIVWQFYPEYFSTVLPMAMQAYSETRDDNPILSYAGNALSIIVPAFLFFRLRFTSPYRRDIFYLGGLLPFFFVYALLNNNWAYTYYPLSSVALILNGFVLWEFIYLRQSHKERGLPAWLFTTGICACLASFLFRVALSVNLFIAIAHDACSGNVQCMGDNFLVAELHSEHGPRSFGAISIEFARWTRVAMYADAPWVTRFPHLWMMPKFLFSDNDFRKQHQWIIDYVANGFADDMDHRKPDVMFVDNTNVIYDRYVPVDFIGYFSGNAHFRDAWSHYRLERRIDMCGKAPLGKILYKSNCSYDVYRRIP